MKRSLDPFKNHVVRSPWKIVTKKQKNSNAHTNTSTTTTTTTTTSSSIVGKTNRKVKASPQQAVIKGKIIGTKFIVYGSKPFHITCRETSDYLLLNMDEAWPALCLDLYAINYLSEHYFLKNKDLQPTSSYWSPLGFFDIPKDVKVSIYYRIYKQIPLIMCIRLSVFRWMAGMIKTRLNLDKSNQDDTKAHSISPLVDITYKIKHFLSKMFDNIETVMSSNRNNSMSIPKKATEEYNLKRVVKTRIILTENGKRFLGNKSDTFQPTVPHAIIPNIKNSLQRDRLFCPILHADKKNMTLASCVGDGINGISTGVSTNESIRYTDPLYYHEHMKKSVNNKIDRKTLGEFRWDLKGLEKARHNIILHLAGWEEGSAMFGLHQIFGTNESVCFQNALWKIFNFVDKVTDLNKKEEAGYTNLNGQINIGAKDATVTSSRDDESNQATAAANNLFILANLASDWKKNNL